MFPEETVDSVLSTNVKVPLLIGLALAGSVLLNIPVSVVVDMWPLADGFIAGGWARNTRVGQVLNLGGSKKG